MSAETFPDGETFLDGKVTLHAGDCLAVLDRLPENSIDACVTDPPYHLTSIVKRFGASDAAPAQHGKDGLFARSARGFMGKTWDGGDVAFRPETWVKVLRVLKPGAHLLAFSAARNFGHLQIAVEAAGFETRDCILDIIDLDPRITAFVGSLSDEQRAAFLRCIEDSDFGGLMAWIFGSGFPKSHRIAFDYEKRLCETRDGKFYYRDSGEAMRREPPFRHPLAEQWSGAGTALKPAFEPIIVARKPLGDGMSVAENVEAFGTGALNIDAARIAGLKPQVTQGVTRDPSAFHVAREARISGRPDEGRWPANVLTDGSPAALSEFPVDVAGRVGVCELKPSPKPARGDGYGMDRGTAARFFYSAKADASDRLGSRHPTVKPVDLMQYLVRAVTAPGQVVLDLFAGTGVTGEACFREGRRAVLIEREAEYQADIRRRMHLALGGPEERKRESIKARLGVETDDAGPLFGGSEEAVGGGQANLRRVRR